MLEQLKRVMPAVSTKDLVPALMHVAIHEQALHAFDGRVYMRVPIKTNLETAVPAKRLLAALELAAGDERIELTREVMHVRCDRLRLHAKLPTMAVEAFPFPVRDSSTKALKLKTPLLPALSAVKGFVGEDASRAWCATVLLRDGKAVATNNVVLVETPAPALPRAIAIPKDAVDVIVHINAEPKHVRIDDVAVELEYSDGALVRAQLIADEWPDTDAVFERAYAGATMRKAISGLADTVRHLRAFCPDPDYPIIELLEDRVATLDGPTAAHVKTKLPGVAARFHADPLAAVFEVAEKYDLTRYPLVPWQSSVLKGVLTGVRT